MLLKLVNILYFMIQLLLLHKMREVMNLGGMNGKEIIKVFGKL
jgi:hypothetical protein